MTVELTKSEKLIVELLLTNLNLNEIAAKLFIHRNSVRFHLTNIYRKYGVKNRVQLIILFLNKNTNIEVCPLCKSKTLKESKDKINLPGVPL